MTRKATPDMDRAKVNRGLAEAFEPRGLPTSKLWPLARCWRSDGEPQDFFGYGASELVLMCLDCLIVTADKLVIEEGVRPLPVRLDVHMLDGRVLHVVGATLAEAIVLATAKAKGIER